jgi:Pentatricopeptide repeat domain
MREQAHTKIGPPTAHSACSMVSSMPVEENSSDRLSTLPSTSTTKTASEFQSSEPGPTKPDQIVIEEGYNTTETLESTPISQPPSYAAGKPWAPENVKTVNLPKYTLRPLRRLRKETALARQLYKQAQNAGEVNPPSRAKRERRRKKAGEDTTSMKEPSLQDYKQEQNASKVTPPMKKPPFPDAASQLIQHFLIIGSTDSVTKGWDSYVFLVDFISGTVDVRRHIQHIPFAHLHRLARLLARNRPQTRRQFFQLLAVLTYINYWGGTLKQYEWNALVAHAGSGWRKTKFGSVRNAMNVFNDMRAGRVPSSSDVPPPDREFLEGPPVEPDIYTYTSLLAIASRTIKAYHVHNISSMLTKAGLPPNRITHLSLMRYFTLRKDFNGIRLTLLKMRQQGLELGLDGLNSCLWAYGRNHRLDVVVTIYRILRHNVVPETSTGLKEINQIIRRLEEEYIFVEPEIRPNEVTFTTVIQVMAYYGHFSSAIDVFMDLLSFKNLEKGAPVEEISAGVYEPVSYQPSLAVFRAIFLGFSRHAEQDEHLSDWNMDNLSHIFDLFLELPSYCSPNHNTIYFIMLAFDKASGRDMEVLRDVWMRIDRRFGIVLHKVHSVSRLARLRRLLFSDEEIEYHHRFRQST